MVAGDMNCDLSNAAIPRAKLLLAACVQTQHIDNDSSFTYIHHSGSTSSLDLMLCSPVFTPPEPSHVDFSFGASDHFHILNSFAIDSSRATVGVANGQ